MTQEILQQSINRRRRRQTQFVWFVRYGLTEYPLVEDLGPYDSDIDPGEGIDHAMSIAKRIAAGVDKGDARTIDDSIPSVVYASPFLRTAHTGHIVASELEDRRQRQQKSSTSDNDDPVVELRMEEGLWEWLIPSLLVTKADNIKTHPRPLPVLEKDLLERQSKRECPHPSTIALDYVSVNPYDDSGDAGVTCVPERVAQTNSGTVTTKGTQPCWIESEERLLKRCETTLLGLLEAHADDATSFCIVSHAPCDQALAFCLEQQSAPRPETFTPKDSKLTPWPLGGITIFSREVLYSKDTEEDGEHVDCKPTGFGNWKMELYGDTDHMPGDYKSGLKKWSLPCFAK